MSVIIAKASSSIKPPTKSYAVASAAGITQKELNTKDANGRTVLFYASRYGKTQVVKNLLNAGSDPNIADNDGNTALHEATERSHMDVMRILLKNGQTNVDVKNRHGQTPVMKAVLYDDAEAVKLLHKSGANLNEQDTTGKTALLLAFADGREKATDYLIKNGSDVNIVDKLGQSCLFLGFSSYHVASPSNIRRLLKAGYDKEKDRSWLAKAGIDMEMFQHKNFFKRIMERITMQPTGRRHSEGFPLRNSSQHRAISHAHPRFRFRNNSAIL